MAIDAEARPERPKTLPLGTLVRPDDGVQHQSLDEAWAEYDAAIAKVDDGVSIAIANQFNVATEKGDLDSAVKWQAIDEAYARDGKFPVEPETKSIITSATNAMERAKADLGRVYESVVKELTVGKKIADAKTARSEWTTVTSRTAKLADRKPRPPTTNQPQKPSEVQQRATAKDTVYLSDLQERDAVVGWGKFGKNGLLGYSELDGRVRVGGKLFEKSLSMHGVRNGLAKVTYDVPDGYGYLESIAAIADTVDGRQKTALTFKVLGDGSRVLWSSRPLHGGGTTEICRVDVKGSKRVTLVVECLGDNGWSQAVWCDPRFTAARR